MPDDGDLLPPLFRVVDEASVLGQRRHMWASAARLVLTILAAVCAALASDVAVGEVAIAGLLAALAFLGALVVEVWLLVVRPERAWYDGRAIAESIKTMAWRYLVGGAPFGLDQAGARDHLHGSMAELEQAAAEVAAAPEPAGAVTAAMDALRIAPLAERRRRYVEDRIVDQQSWYGRKAVANAARAARLKIAMLIGEALGVGFAVSEAFGYLNIGLSGIASTSIGAGAAWLAVRQHESTARTYALASTRLAEIADRLRHVDGEESWALEVAGAEEAITREHAAWHAARTDRVLPAGT